MADEMSAGNGTEDHTVRDAADSPGIPAQMAIPAEIRRKLKENWGLLMALGIFLIIGGLSAILLPVAASLAVELMVGLVFLFAGAMQGVHAWRCTGWDCRLWSGLSALLYVLGGVFLLLNPFAGLIALTTIMILIIGLDGAFRIMMGLKLSPTDGWGWTVAGGVAGMAMAVLMLVFLPAIGLTALGIFAGIALLFEGWGFVILALASRRDQFEAEMGPGHDEQVPAL